MLALASSSPVASARRTLSWRPPGLCAICRGWGRGRVCDTCLHHYASPQPRCRRCALPVDHDVDVCGACLVDPPPYAQAVAAVDYDHPWDALITRFKFHGALELAPALAQLMRDAVERTQPPMPTPSPRKLLLPIPLAASRLRERGYNQAWELARRLGRTLRCEADAHLLLRIKETPHQIALPLQERAGNVRRAFAVEPRRRAELRGRAVVLVDDVMTTGATFAEAAHVLLQAGAAEVAVWAVARTPRAGDA